MLKLISHLWLILSLLVVPVQFATADMTMLDHGQMKCDMMEMDSSMEHDMSSSQGGCECSDQCKVSCAGAHISLAMNTVIPMAYVGPSTKPLSRPFSAAGIDQLLELRPPKKLHA